MQTIDDIFLSESLCLSRVPSIELDEAASIIDILQGSFESGSAFSSFDAYKNFAHHCVRIFFLAV
jgi:hypothetical protein